MMLSIARSIIYFAALFLSTMLFSTVENARAQEVMIPNFWDKNVRYTKPDLSNLPRLRYLTTTDFPPFNFIDRKRRLAGFHVDLARAICVELELLNRCEIQALPWEELQKAIENGDGEALLAGHAINPENLKNFEFSHPYIRIPGRFVARRNDMLQKPAYDALFREKTGVISGSKHAAYFADIFSTRQFVEFPTRSDALTALKNGEIAAVFSDALSLSFWLNSADEADCCDFLDKAFLSEKHFGPGLAVALPKNRPELTQAMNYALSRLNRDGTFAELYLRYFPIGLF